MTSKDKLSCLLDGRGKPEAKVNKTSISVVVLLPNYKYTTVIIISRGTNNKRKMGEDDKRPHMERILRNSLT